MSWKYKTIDKCKMSHVLLIVALSLFLTHFLDYSKWNFTLGGQLGHVLFIVIFFLFFLSRDKIRNLKNPFKFELGVFAITPFLTYISQIYIYGESFMVIKLYSYFLITAIFYVFYIYKYTEREIVKAFVVVAVAIAVIQIVQILFPSLALFGLGDTTKDLEIRNGLLRYRFTTIYYTTFALFYFWNKCIIRKNVFFLFMFFLFVISDYLYLTRQYMAGMFVAILFSTFFIKDRTTKRMTFILVMAFVFLLISYSDSLLSFFVDSTKNDASEDNIRLFAYEFYGQKIIDSPIAFLFGNGFPADQEYWQENYLLFVSDIGVVGQVFTHGIFWEIAYLSALYKMFWKYRKCIPLYIKLFALSGFVHCAMVASYGGASTLFTWLSVLYICSQSVTGCQQSEMNNKVRISNV